MKNFILLTALFICSHAFSQGFTGFTFKNDNRVNQIKIGKDVVPFEKSRNENKQLNSICSLNYEIPTDTLSTTREALIDSIISATYIANLDILDDIVSIDKATIYEAHNSNKKLLAEILILEKALDSRNIDITKIDKDFEKQYDTLDAKKLEYDRKVRFINSRLFDYLTVEEKKSVKNYNVGDFFFPNRFESYSFHKLLYQEDSTISYVKHTGFSIGDQSGSIYSELLSGNLGPFRVSLGSMIAASNQTDEEEKKEEEAFQRLINYGGNTVLTFEYPLFYLKGKQFKSNFLGRFLAKGTADFPAFGTTTDDWAGSGVAGLNLYCDLSLDENNLRFFFDVNGSFVVSSNTFKENLGVENNNFTFCQLVVGFVVLENIKLSFNVGTFSSEKILEGRNVTAGGQILNNSTE